MKCEFQMRNLNYNKLNNESETNQWRAFVLQCVFPVAAFAQASLRLWMQMTHGICLNKRMACKLHLSKQCLVYSKNIRTSIEDDKKSVLLHLTFPIQVGKLEILTATRRFEFNEMTFIFFNYIKSFIIMSRL